MNSVEDRTNHKTCEAQAWLEKLEPSLLPNDFSMDYPKGPVFSDSSVPKTIRFLMDCAASESKHHSLDKEMGGVKLTIAFEYDTMHVGQLELAFTFSHPEHSGSISYSVSVVKDGHGTFHAFGDDRFRRLG